MIKSDDMMALHDYYFSGPGFPVPRLGLKSFHIRRFEKFSECLWKIFRKVFLKVFTAFFGVDPGDSNVWTNPEMGPILGPRMTQISRICKGLSGFSRFWVRNLTPECQNIEEMHCFIRSSTISDQFWVISWAFLQFRGNDKVQDPSPQRTCEKLFRRLRLWKSFWRMCLTYFRNNP